MFGSANNAEKNSWTTPRQMVLLYTDVERERGGEKETEKEREREGEREKETERSQT